MFDVSLLISMETLASLWASLGWPLLRLLFFVSIGLLLANLIESLNWTHRLARLATPLIRRGNLSDIAGASFVMAFFSGISANTMLAEGFDQRKISKKELVLANLFNSLPTYFLHLPTLFFLSVPLIRGAAFIYVGLTLLAAVLRTATVVGLGRLLLAERPAGCVACRLEQNQVSGWRQILALTWQRYKRRIRRILIFIVPIYVLFYALLQLGIFAWLEQIFSRVVPFPTVLHPQSLSIVVLQLGAEASVALAAAGALLDAGTLGYREIVLALLVGNVVSSPLRAVRHQFPYYAGIFSPRLALELIVYNQGFRVVSLILVGTGFYYFY
jgi:hypothetical protein